MMGDTSVDRSDSWLERRNVPLLIFLLSFLWRMAWMIYTQPVPVSDFEEYRHLAELLLEHHQLGYPNPSAYRLPGYPAFLATLMTLNRSVMWLSFWNIILSSLLTVIVYCLTYHLTSADRRASTLASLVCSVNPTFVFFAPLLASEHLFAVLLFSGLLLLFSQHIHPVISCIVAGLGLGFAILTRGEGVFYVPIFVLAAFLLGKSRIHAFLFPLILAVACVAIVLPWYVRNVQALGQGAGLSTSAGGNFYYAHNTHGYHQLAITRFEGLSEVEQQNLGYLSEVEQQNLGYRLGWEYLIQDPSRILWDVARGTFGLYSPPIDATAWSTRLPRSSPSEPWPVKPLPGLKLFDAVAVLFYLGLLVTAMASIRFSRDLTVRAWVLLAGIIMMNWVCYGVVFLAVTRYRFTAEIVLCILAGSVLAGLSDSILNLGGVEISHARCKIGRAEDNPLQ